MFVIVRYAGLSWSLFLIETAIFEWCVVGCGSKNGYQKNMCLKEIGLHAQNLLTILGSIINIIGGLPFNELEESLTLIMNEIFI